MLQPNTFYRTSIKALVFDGNKKILLTKDEGTNKWDFPGGGMDWGESPQACLAMEIEEEMDIKTTWISDYPSYFIPDQSEKGVFTDTIKSLLTKKDVVVFLNSGKSIIAD